jgi:hypothetical protein
MRRLGASAQEEAECLFTGGATAVLLGWRASTIDVDLRLVPDVDSVLRALPMLKDELDVNIELVSPGDFVPLPEGTEGRAIFAGREGRLTFRHVDPYAQALAKIERGHTRDVADVTEMAARGLIDAERLLELFEGTALELYRFPAIDPASYRAAVEDMAERLRDR